MKKQLNLKTVYLSEGAIAGFDIGFWGSNGAYRKKYRNPLKEGYDGIEFIGAGQLQTHILPNHGQTTSDDSTVLIGKGCGVVSFKHVTIHAAQRKAIHVGDVWKGESLEPSVLKLTDCTVLSDEPAGSRLTSTVWGILTYNTDIDFKGVTLDLRYSAEHGLYAHGFYKRGVRWCQCNVKAVGAEGLKVSTRPEEVAFVTGAQILVQDCSFSNWYQPGSWRGGGGVVLQGSGASKVHLDRCRFWGGSMQRGRCFMVDDGGGVRNGQARFYDVDTGGQSGKGPANGDIIVERCGFSAGPGPAHYGDMMRVGPIAPPPQKPVVAKSVRVSNCGFYGQQVKVGIFDVSDGVLVEGCNTAALTTVAQARGVDVTYDAALHVEKNWISNIRSGYNG